MKKWMTIGALAFAVVAADATFTPAQDTFVDENGDGIDDGAARNHRFGRRGILRGVRAQLTDEQKAEVKAAMEELKNAEASRDEIQAALSTLLEGYGIEVPEPGDRLNKRLGGVLTEEHLADLRAEIDGLREAEASHVDIRAAFKAKLTEFGINPASIRPEKQGRRGFGKFRGRRGGFRGPAPAPADEPAAADGN